MTFYVVVVPSFDITRDRWTEVERRSVIDQRWWTVAELASTSVTVYPESLVDLVRSARPNQA